MVVSDKVLTKCWLSIDNNHKMKELIKKNDLDGLVALINSVIHEYKRNDTEKLPISIRVTSEYLEHLLYTEAIRISVEMNNHEFLEKLFLKENSILSRAPAFLLKDLQINSLKEIYKEYFKSETIKPETIEVIKKRLLDLNAFVNFNSLNR